MKRVVQDWRGRPISIMAAILLLFFQIQAQASSLPDFTKLVEAHSPAVVNISTVSHIKSNQSPFGKNMDQVPEFFRHFFGGPNSPYRGGAPRERQSLGSGFIVSTDGYVLTNYHVVKGADEITVRLSDRRELKAKLVGADKRSDIAVLKINAKNLPVVTIGHSDKLKPGQWVFAIGSPFGFDYTVTAGIVSAVGRNLPDESYVPFIQTDVAINPGNSGGPLFNMDGEVVGINSQIYTRSGGFMGVSFSIPIDVAMNVVHQLKEKGYVSRGWLGVLIQEVNKDLAESFGLKTPHGALVAQVLPNSPSAKAGVKVGDIIVDYDDQKVIMSSDLPHLVGSTPVGKTVELVVLRNGKKKTLSVKIGELPKSAGEDQAKPAVAKKASNRINVEVEKLNEDIKKQFDVDQGVIITGVGQGAGQNAGLREGDVIKSIDNQTVNTVADFDKIVKGLPANKAIPVLIVRQGSPSFIVMKLDK